jgi:pyruvate/2-oxoglutarate dehydrogenase complex dihydrolipoamide dehydrogenase (E3) component
MPDERDYDLIVLGGGKAGKTLAMNAGHAGHRVALVELGRIGGSCINVACIPTKALVASAEVTHLGHTSAAMGVALAPDPDPFPGAFARKSAVVQHMVDNHWRLFGATPGLDLLLGRGRLQAGPNGPEVAVVLDGGATVTLRAPRIVVNTGADAVVPPLPGLAEVPFLTSESALALTSAPESLVVLGGGYIAVELAQVFGRLGSRVTMLIRESRFLPREDEAIAETLAGILRGEGIDLRFAVEVAGVRGGDAGVSVTLADGSQVAGSHLLVATGRAPLTGDLGLDEVGVQVDTRGGIVVGPDLATSVLGIYAAGDCTGGPQFTHVSWDDFRVLNDVLFGADARRTTDRLVPYTLFTTPELGRVGLTTEQAIAAGFEVRTAQIPAAVIPRAVTSGHTEGLLQAVVDATTHRILGCSILCHGGGEVMALIQLAMIADQPYEVLRDTIWTHPTMAESLNLLFATLEPLAAR